MGLDSGDGDLQADQFDCVMIAEHLLPILDPLANVGKPLDRRFVR